MNGKRAKRIAQAAILALSLLTPFLPTQVLQSLAAQKADAAFEQQLAAEGFPESYKQKLRELHAKYPNWEFKAYQTGLSWQEVVREESKLGRNLVHTTSKDSWKSKDAAAYNASTNTWKGFDTSAWVAANPDIIGYYMDPRNFLDGRYIFQFQTQGYDPASQNAEGVRMLAANSFLNESGASIVGSRSAVENQSSSADSGISEATKVAGASGKSPSAVLWAAPGTLRDSENVQVGEAPLSEQEQQSRAAANGSRPAVPTRGETATKQEERAIGVLAGAPRDRLAASEAVQGESVSDAESSAENTDPAYGEVQPVDVDASASGLSDVSTGEEAETETVAVDATETSRLEEVHPYDVSVEGDAESQRIEADIQGVIRRGAAGASQNSTTSQSGGSGGGGTVSGDGSGSNPAGVDYISTIMDAANSSGVNPYVLTAMLIQEQGRAGGSGLISGKNPKYPGFYNYFNAQAFQDGDKTPTERGLWWASLVDTTYGKPWNTPEKAIIGGAKYYGDNYLKSGQDTFYLKKFNVTEKGRYEHQYMTNVQAAAEEGRKLGEAYTEDLKQKKHTFRIPVYQDMPESAAVQPN